MKPFESLRSGSARALLILCASLILSACATTGKATEPTAVTAPAFQQTITGYMAELGQCMDDVYRFWDSKSMHEVSLQRLDRMIEIHDACLGIYEDYLAKHSIEAYRDEQEPFKSYLLKSRELTIELKEAVISKDDARILAAFGKLDQNRRDAHSAFGEAL